MRTRKGEGRREGREERGLKRGKVEQWQEEGNKGRELFTTPTHTHTHKVLPHREYGIGSHDKRLASTVLIQLEGIKFPLPELIGHELREGGGGREGERGREKEKVATKARSHTVILT